MRRLILIAGWLAALAQPLPAAEITRAECDALRAENQGLVSAGVPKLMEKGAEWAKGALTADQLGQIKRLIHVSEQITFRCETIRPVNAKVEKGGEADGIDTVDDPAEPAAAQAAPAEPGPVVPPSPAKPKPKPAPNTRAGANPEAPKPKGPDTAAQPAPKASAKPSPKPKANDAFVPPAGGPTTLNDQAAKRP